MLKCSLHLPNLKIRLPQQLQGRQLSQRRPKRQQVEHQWAKCQMRKKQCRLTLETRSVALSAIPSRSGSTMMSSQLTCKLARNLVKRSLVSLSRLLCGLPISKSICKWLKRCLVWLKQRLRISWNAWTSSSSGLLSNWEKATILHSKAASTTSSRNYSTSWLASPTFSGSTKPMWWFLCCVKK